MGQCVGVALLVGAYALAAGVENGGIWAAPDSVSIGVAEWQSGEDRLSFLGRADEAVYAAKRAGKNCVSYAK